MKAAASQHTNTPSAKHASRSVTLERIVKRFGDLVAVRDISLSIQPGEFFSLLGPSGCGKTTLLRIIAGFEKADEGRIWIGDTDMTAASPQRRPTAMVFQNYALFPTMTVGENVAYGLEVRKVERSERKRRVAQALARVDLTGREDTVVTNLSGGQQQRVALARALAVQPSILLFDEPLSNLDVALREQTRRELTVLQEELGTTSIYVTHDQQEALALSDRIAVMRSGAIQQVGTPTQLYQEPATVFVAQFLGSANIVSDPKVMHLFAGEEAPGPGQVLAIRPEHIRPNSAGAIEARLLSRQFLGMFTEWWLAVEGQTFRAWVDPSTEPHEVVRLTATQHRWVEND